MLGNNKKSIGFNTLLYTNKGGFDPDATAFFLRVTAAGGSLTNTEKTAVNNLVLDMKAANIWTTMKAVYPMVGASAAACAQNLISSSFTGIFNGGVTYASSGVTPNGLNAFMNTNFIPSVYFTSNNSSIGVYSRTNNINDNVFFGTEISGITRTFMFVKYTALGTSQIQLNSSTNSAPLILNSSGLITVNRNIANQQKVYQNGILISTIAALENGFSTVPLYIFADNNNGNAQYFSNRQLAFVYISNGLTDTNSLNLYTAVQAFQTTLSRQV